MAGLAWRTDRTQGLGVINGTDLFRPQIVFRHIGEPAKRPQTPHGLNGPTGFLNHLAVKRRQRRFPRINPAAGQLIFRMRVLLMGYQNLLTPQQNGINPVPHSVGLIKTGRFTDTLDHNVPLVWLL